MKVSYKRNFKFSHKKDGTKLSNAISGITGCPCRAGIQYVYLHIYIHIYSCWSLIHVCKSIRGGGFFGTGPSTWRDNSPQLGEYQTHILSSFHTNILVQQSPPPHTILHLSFSVLNACIMYILVQKSPPPSYYCTTP